MIDTNTIKRVSLFRQISALVTLVVTIGTATLPAWGSGHRDAPALLHSPGADISDVYAFRSWVDPDKVVLIMNAVPAQDPGDGPLYFTFDDTILYRIHIDNDKNGVADDVVYEFQFSTQDRPVLGIYTFAQANVGHPDIPIPGLQGIIALDGPGSEGIIQRQTYTVTEVRHGKRHVLFRDRTLVSVPSNVGPTTMPDYEALAAKGIYADNGSGIRVFSGQRAETFYCDINAIFDLNVRGFPLLTPEQESNDFVNPFGINRYAGFNINTIAIEVPIERVTRNGNPIIGVFASTSRRKHLKGGSADEHASGSDNDLVQVGRMANPMIPLLLVDMPLRNEWNRSKPENDARFLDLFTNPSPARFPTTPYVFKIPSPPPPRLELVRLFLKYPGQALDHEQCGQPCAELLRLDLRVPPTVPAKQKRMGLLGGDPAGLPNGRRPNDDATDFGLRVVGGPMPIELRLSDGVNFMESAPGAGTSDGVGYGVIPGNRLDVTVNGIAKEFPFLPTPHSGRDHRHTH
jgi:hypothetical protein